MADYTCTIGGVAFGNDGSGGRECLFVVPEAAQYDVKRYGVPGVNGFLKVRAGRRGRTIRARLRYAAALDTALGYYEADRDAWENDEVAITLPGGTAPTRCELADMRIIDLRAVGGGEVFLEVEAAFEQDS